MNVLIDTNVLLHIANPDSPDRTATMSAVVALRKAGAELCLVPQVIYEYWVVATRPASANGQGMSTAEAQQSLQLFVLQRFCIARPDSVQKPYENSGQFGDSFGAANSLFTGLALAAGALNTAFLIQPIPNRQHLPAVGRWAGEASIQKPSDGNPLQQHGSLTQPELS